MALLDFNRVEELFVHCSDSPNGGPHTAADVDAWHKERGFYRGVAHPGELRHVGYHVVIECSGVAVVGRRWDEVGSHVAGHNSRSWGVCMIGRDKFTIPQWEMLRELVRLRLAIRPLRIRGHREVNPGKTCPGFSVVAWLAGGMVPLEGHVYVHP